MPGTLINPSLTTVPTMAPPPTVQQLPSPGTRIMVPSSLAPVQALPPGPIASSLGISAPSVLTAQPPPILVQTQIGPPPQLLGPPQLPGETLVTPLPQEVPVVSQATIIPAVSPWGPPHSSIPAQMISRNSPPAASTPSHLSSTPHVTTSYSYAPREEPRRRFTEEKVEDKVPENLLGYEHGPPHLANLVVQGSPQQSQHEPPPVVSTHPPYQPQVSEMYSMATMGQPIQTSPSLLPEDRNFTQQGLIYGDDKQLMPPPPIPASLKRSSTDRLGGSDRKKERLSPNEYREEEEKARGKYQYNHISNAPQLYTQAEADNFQDQRPQADNEPPPGYQFQPPQPITEQYQYQPGQQPGTHLLPPPPAPLSVMSSLPSHPIQQPMYSISPSQSPPNIYTQQQEVLTSTGHPYTPHTITLSAPEQILPPEARPEEIQPPLEQLQQPPPSYTTMPPPPISSSQYLASPQTMPLMAPPTQPPVSYAPPPAMSVQPPNYPPPGMPYYITSQ